MAIEIGPGWTIGGGISIVQPPDVPTAGWYAGGLTTVFSSSISRSTFATDTATTTSRGSLASNSFFAAGGTGTNTNGWFGGGYSEPASFKSSVNRITYATDTETASSRGPLAASGYGTTATSDGTTYGWWGGNKFGPSSWSSVVSRIVFATDTATASLRGPLTTNKSAVGATGNTTDGWYGGGENPPGFTIISTVDRITYATDTATAVARGPLAVISYRMAGMVTDISTYGWYAIGQSGGASSMIQRITYANDTATSVARGPLTSARYYGSATSDNSTYGWFAGGNPGPKSSIDRITFATDTATATVSGPLSSSCRAISSSSGIQ
jgi:hypothetical protein